MAGNTEGVFPIQRYQLPIGTLLHESEPEAAEESCIARIGRHARHEI